VQSKIQEVEADGSRKSVNASTVLKAEDYRGKIRSALKDLSSAEVANIVFEDPI
jgi:hypothetical protein